MHRKDDYMNIDRQAIKFRNYENDQLLIENRKLRKDKLFWMKLAIIAMIGLYVAMILSLRGGF